MSNNGSPNALLSVINDVERVNIIKEGQIKTFVKDTDTGDWVAAENVPELPGPYGSVVTGGITVADSVAQLSSVPVDGVELQASSNNSGIIYIGASSSLTSSNGYELPPGGVKYFPISNLNMLYAMADVNGDKLKYVGVVR